MVSIAAAASWYASDGARSRPVFASQQDDRRVGLLRHRRCGGGVAVVRVCASAASSTRPSPPVTFAAAASTPEPISIAEIGPALSRCAAPISSNVTGTTLPPSASARMSTPFAMMSSSSADAAG
jgi:hypothetical protein